MEKNDVPRRRGRPRPVRRLVMEVTGLAAVVELFDTAVVELFEDDEQAAA